MISICPPGQGGFFDPLVRHGNYYYNADGSPFTVKETSAFRLYERLLYGEEITPTLANWTGKDGSGLSFNVARVWLLNTSVGHILPWEHPDFYDRLPDLVSLCAEFGIRVEYTLFTQTQTLMPTLKQQQDHFDRVVNSLGAAFYFLEGANENDQHDNAIHEGLHFWKPAGATFDLCSGSCGSGVEVPMNPILDSIRYHTNDASEWWRKQAHNGMEMADAAARPCIANENTRPDRDGNGDHHFDAGAGAALLTAGSCLHSTTGKDATPFYNQVDYNCALAFCTGVNGIDLSQRTAPYERLEGSQKPSNALRMYRRGTQVVIVRN